jgi:ABC-type transporter Mla maintaining outer membrane lipid asymmetry ATPase subunit MlaF
MDLTKDMAETRALDAVTLKVEASELTVIIGPSGLRQVDAASLSERAGALLTRGRSASVIFS